MNVLVLGATGFIGGEIARRLAEEGVSVRCARRRRSNILGIRRLPHVELDLDVPATLALEDYDVVVHGAGLYPRDALDPVGSRQRALAQTDALLAALRPDQRLIYLSSTATVAPNPGGASTEAHRFAEAPGFGLYHDLKWSMEERFSARPNTVVLCPSAVLGAGDWKVGTCALLVALARGLNPQHPDGIVSLVDVRDVATAVLRLLTVPAPERLLLSTESLPFHALLVRLAERYRVATPPAPLSAAAAIAYADTEERLAHAEGRRARLSREIADLVVHGVPLDASLACTTLGLVPTPIEDTLDTFDAWARRAGLFPPLEEPSHVPA